MATISKFYLLDAASPVSGTLPDASNAFRIHPHSGSGTDAIGAFTSRDATNVAGTSNPDVDATVTASADLNGQILCMRRFLSRPLVAQTFSSADGNWTFSYARGESNTGHNGQIRCSVSVWRPGTGAWVSGSSVGVDLLGTAMGATAETADSVTAAWGATPLTIIDGDVLVFEVEDTFTQGMSVAYTSFFSYNGTTEASTTSCASFVTPPTALTLMGIPPLTTTHQSVPFFPRPSLPS